MLSSYRSCFTLFAVIITLSLSACQGGNTAKNKAKDEDSSNDEKSLFDQQKNLNTQKIATLRPVVAIGDEKIVQPAFLRNNLPESAFAYARIPNVWSFGGVAKGNVFDTAVNAKPFFDAVKGIRSGFNENVIPEIPNIDVRVLTTLLLQNLTSPVEAVAITGVDAAVPTPNLVITASANFKTVDQVQKLLEALAKNTPEIEITKALNADGYAEMSVAKLSAQFQWDQTKSRFFVLVGVSLSPNNLTDVIKTFVANTTHQMTAIENTIDSSGHGVFVWANPRKFSSMGSALGMQRELAGLAVMGVSSMKNIAMGTGTSNGINRFKYVVEMPVSGFRSYMPIINSSPEFSVMGKTKMVGVLGLPSRADFVAIENTIALVSQAKDMEGYYKFKKEFNKALGFEVEDIFDFFGQDISFVSDEAGSYLAIRLNDAEKFKTTLEASVTNLNLEYEQRTISGHTYQHLKIPSIYTKYLDEEFAKDGSAMSSSANSNKLIKRLFGVPSHVYWEQEGDYLIMSGIPQTLIDRHYIESKTSVKDWLEKQQRINPDGSLMMFSMSNEGTAKKMYSTYLGLLNFAADFSGKPIDMFAIATPHEAKIPNESSYGFKVTSSETQLAFELNYESNPFEFLLAGNAYAGVAVLGIMSSIAVPAYNDYLIRSRLTSGILGTQTIKLQLNEFEIEYGRYPNQYEIEDLKLNNKNSDYSIEVSPDNGEITVKYTQAELRTRNTLKMIPPKQGVSTTWTCQAKIKNRYLPASCRKKF